MARLSVKKTVLSVLVCTALIFGTALPVYATEDKSNESTLQEIVSEENNPSQDISEENTTSFEEEVLDEDTDTETAQDNSANLEEEASTEVLDVDAAFFKSATLSNNALEEDRVINEETLIAAIMAREPVIELAGSFNITSPITIDSGYEVTLASDNSGPHTLHRDFSTGALFDVQGGSKLTLQHVVLDGNSISSAGSLVQASGQSTVTLDAGAVLKNNTTTGSGGGIAIVDSSVLFLNNTSRIENNAASDHGGGVYIGYSWPTGDNSKLYMNGGVVTQNTSNKGGGGIWIGQESEGYLSGGETSANSTPSGFGGGLGVHGYAEFSGGNLSNNVARDGGGGVYNESYFKMTGGHISGNSCTSTMVGMGDGGGIISTFFASTEILGGVIGGDTSEDANIANNGGGLYQEGLHPSPSDTKTIISGDAVIKGNEARSLGGGFCVSFYGANSAPIRSVEISGNAQIINNKAQHAGGVYLSSKLTSDLVNTTFGGNALIANNQAASQAGGMYLIGIQAKFTDSFTVSGNSASTGGGIRTTKTASYPTTSLTLQDKASVVENTAELGGGICISGGAPLETSGDVSIDSNTGGTGAGLFIQGSTVTLGGNTTVSNNKADFTEASNNTAGAVYVARSNVGTQTAPVYEPGVLNVSEHVAMEGNTAGKETGGIRLDAGAIMNLSGSAIITGNAKVGKASGIALNQGATLNVWGTPQVGTSKTDNGVYLASGMTATIPSGQDLDEGAQINFDGLEDTASEGTIVAQREDGSEAATNESAYMLYTPGRYVVVKDEATPSDYVLEEATYTVTYYDGGAESGEVPVDESVYKQGDAVTILGNTGELAAKGMDFLGWGPSLDYEGEPLQPGDTIEITDDHIELYALWDLDSRIGPDDPNPDNPDPGTDPDNSDPGTNPDNRSGLPSSSGNTNTGTGASGGTGDNTNDGTGGNSGTDGGALGKGSSSLLAKTFDGAFYVLVGLAALIAAATLAVLLRRARS